MKRTTLNLFNRKRNADVINDMETDPLTDWKNGFLLTPKRRSLSHNESSINFNSSTPAPLATLDEDESESKVNQENIERTDDEACTSATLDTPKNLVRTRRSLSVPLINCENRGSTSSNERDVHVPSTQQTSLCGSPTTDDKFALSKIECRPHLFERKRMFTKNTCDICASNIRFGIEAVKCQTCKSICHQHCSRRAPIPCIPWSAPLKATNGRLRLGDYCAGNVVPKLPHLIIRCVLYLNAEKCTRGLYTNYDHSNEVELLLKLLHDKNPPDLKGYGPQTTALCVIKFLSDIRESLIPESSFHEFSEASKEADNFGIEAAIYELPIVHKNTLAYLFIHWKLLYEQNEINGLTVDSLGRVLTPVIMRGIDTNPDSYMPIFSRLLSLSITYWESVIEEGVKFFVNTPISRSSSKKIKADLSRSITVAKLQQTGSMRRF